MKEILREITKAEYDEYSLMDKGAFNNLIEKSIPIHWAMGYGWYGVALRKKDEKYYLVHSIGESCD